MDQFKRGEYQVNLVDAAAAHWGTANGVAAYTRLMPQLNRLPDLTLVRLDFSKVEITDVSFQREAVVELLQRFRPRLLFAVSGVPNPDVRANLELALYHRGATLLLCDSQGGWDIVGKPLAAEMVETLRLIHSSGELTSAKLTVPPFRLESSTASARLTNLWKAGLVARMQGVAPSGGKEYRYFRIC
jgi:hypothetical protein